MKPGLIIATPLLAANSMLFGNEKIRHRCDALRCKASLPSRRRDFVSLLTTTVIVATGPPRRLALAKTANDATTVGRIALNFNGVYDAPGHPNGFRILIGNEDSRTVALTLRDVGGGKVYSLPVEITEVEAVTAEDGNKDSVVVTAKQFTFDFTPVGGSPNEVGTFSKNLEGVPVISFPDGTSWTKREKGPAGVYRDGFDAKKIIVIRQRERMSRLLTVHVIEGDGTTTTGRAKGGYPTMSFCLPAGKGTLDDVRNKIGVRNTKTRTISFDDGDVWTKF